MKKAFAMLLIFALMFSLFTGAKAVEFDCGEFEDLPYTQPVVTLLSPSSNESYSVSDIPLNVTVEVRTIILHNLERVRWLNYSLDGQTAISLNLIEPSLSEISQLPYFVYGNTMLTGLSNGSHSLTIFGKTSVSGLNGYFNETVIFVVDESGTPEPEPFPTLIVATASIIIVVVVFAVFLLVRKHKH
jgi:hypothetical protein